MMTESHLNSTTPARRLLSGPDWRLKDYIGEDWLGRRAHHAVNMELGIAGLPRSDRPFVLKDCPGPQTWQGHRLQPTEPKGCVAPRTRGPPQILESPVPPQRRRLLEQP